MRNCDDNPIALSNGERIRIVAFAYACEAGKGSEPGAGWIWARMLARIGEVWVITRENNRESIERGLKEIPERGNLHAVYVDLPNWARAWKRGPKGARFYYLLWQIAAVRRARELGQVKSFHLVWHLTWANGWLGSLAPLVGRPFAYGPVGGGVGMYWRLLPAVGVRGGMLEVARGLARAGARYLNPLARLAWRQAELILVQNRETLEWLPARHRKKAVVFSHVVLEDDSSFQHDRGSRYTPMALYVGRLIPWKGVSLAIRAVSFLPGWTLVVCGRGRDEARLRRLARHIGVESRVDFLGWVPSSRVGQLMREADVFLFPSIHDEGGFVVGEALAAGLPVVCLDRGGPPVTGGRAVIPSTVTQTAAALARATLEAVGRKPSTFPDLSSATSRLSQLLWERLHLEEAQTAQRALDRLT